MLELLLSEDFLSALVAIVIIDLVLAGDNAIVIALAARKLPRDLQRKTILWGTIGAIAVRVAMTLAVVALLQVPGLQGAGALLLIWIAYRLLVSEDHASSADQGGSAVTGFWSAIRTIVVADAVMGLDNVLGVAGAAQGSFLLVMLGLLISVPIMVWGSTLVLRLVDRFPLIIYLGAAVLGWTSAKMLTHEALLDDWIDLHAWIRWVLYVAIMGGILLAGFVVNRARGTAKARSPDATGTPP